MRQLLRWSVFPGALLIASLANTACVGSAVSGDESDAASVAWNCFDEMQDMLGLLPSPLPSAGYWMVCRNRLGELGPQGVSGPIRVLLCRLEGNKTSDLFPASVDAVCVWEFASSDLKELDPSQLAACVPLGMGVRLVGNIAKRNRYVVGATNAALLAGLGEQGDCGHGEAVLDLKVIYAVGASAESIAFSTYNGIVTQAAAYRNRPLGGELIVWCDKGKDLPMEMYIGERRIVGVKQDWCVSFALGNDARDNVDMKSMAVAVQLGLVFGVIM